MSKEKATLIAANENVSQLKKLGVFVSLLALATALAALLNLQSWSAGGVTILWPTNGFVVAWLLCEPRRRWPVYLAIAGAADLGLNLFVNGGGTALYLAGCNVLEIWLAAALLYRTIAPDPDLTRRNQLLALILNGMLIAPIVAGGLASFAFAHGALFSHAQRLVFRTWTVADALGMATIAPLYLSYRHRAGFNVRSRTEVATLYSLIIGATLLVFMQSRYPLLFVLLPLLLMLGVRLGLAASAMGLFIVTTIGGLLTSWGYGPANLIRGSDMAQRDLALQVFVAVAMLMLYLLEVVMSESNRLQISLKASETRFRLLAESSRDIIVMTDLHGTRHYVSPAVQEVLGWLPAEMIGHSYREIVHPKDMAMFERSIAECTAGRPTGPMAYRCKTRAGDYRWLEANPRLYQDPLTGKPAGIVSILRDISDRKKNEDELARAFQMVENLASIDGLTGIANRRRFDETLDREWRRAVRDGSEISLVLIDVDHFKLYNDLYGHLSGDDCLRQIAESLSKVVTRAADLAARYGGEEFAVILPNTGRAGALELCREILAAVRRRNILHDGNPHAVVTVSAGCITCLADEESSYVASMLAADAALYRAKALGRNRVEVAEPLSEPVPRNGRNLFAQSIAVNPAAGRPAAGTDMETDDELPLAHKSPGTPPR
jgi:diguanylate cyclase (GGDEF)-like protein/PAS domain S-box-containing protein